MNCPECERYRVLLKIVQSPDRRADLIMERARHIREKHPDLIEEQQAGLASGLWPDKKVSVRA